MEEQIDSCSSKSKTDLMNAAITAELRAKRKAQIQKVSYVVLFQPILIKAVARIESIAKKGSLETWKTLKSDSRI